MYHDDFLVVEVEDILDEVRGKAVESVSVGNHNLLIESDVHS